MNRSMPYYIRKVLLEDKCVFLPAIGMLRLKHTPASISAHRNTIHPPLVELEIKDERAGNNHLLEVIQRGEQIGEHQAHDYIKQYAALLDSELRSAGKTSIDGLASIAYINGRPDIESEVITSSTEYYGLKALKLIPINRLQQQHYKTTTVEDTSFDWMPIVLGFVIGLGLMLLFGLGKMMLSDKNAVIKTAKVIPNTMIDTTLTHEHHTNKYGQIIPSSNECVIITGSLHKESNINRMRDKLSSSGYELYEESFHDLTRIGLVFSCEDTDLNIFIQEVRKNVSEKAWYLDPELTVPYE